MCEAALPTTNLIFGSVLINVLVFFPRYLDDKQKALISAYAELEDDVNGTVNGIEKSAKGSFILCQLGHNFNFFLLKH